MSGNSALKLQNPDSFAAAVKAFGTTNADFSDCLILSETMNQGCQLWTFDRKLGNLENANRLTTDNFKAFLAK